MDEKMKITAIGKKDSNKYESATYVLARFKETMAGNQKTAEKWVLFIETENEKKQKIQFDKYQIERLVKSIENLK